MQNNICNISEPVRATGSAHGPNFRLTIARTELFKKSVCYTGVQMRNELHLHIYECDCIDDVEKDLLTIL